MEQQKPIKKPVWLALALLMAGSLFLMVNSSIRESATMDELAHIPSGYAYIAKADYRLNPEHPPLLKMMSAVPLAFLNLNFPTDIKAWTEDANGQWDMGTAFLYNSGNNADLIIQLSRVAPMLLTLLLILFTFMLGKGLIGEKWALVPASFVALSPTFLAHGHYVTTDVAAAFGVVSATYFFIKAIENPKWKNIVLAGVFFGIAQLLKFSMFLLAPYFALLAALWGMAKAMRSENKLSVLFKQTGEQAKNLAFIFGIGYFLVYPVYFATTLKYPIEKQTHDMRLILNSYGGGPDSQACAKLKLRCIAETTIAMAENKILRPYAQYAFGFLMASQRAFGGNTGYFLGEISAAGWSYYFPVVYALKEPLPLLLAALFAATICAAAFVKKPIKAIKKMPETVGTKFPEAAMIIFIAVYSILSIRSPLNIGIRHLMPILPFIYILSVQAIRNWNVKIAKPIAAMALVWVAGGTIAASPYYISYFNEVGGGIAGGYKYVTDSNYDWGQDLKRLASFVEENNIKRIAVDYFGGGNPKYYMGEDRVEYWQSAKGNPASEGIEWLAVSVNTLQQAKARTHEGFNRNSADEYSWLKNPYEPYAKAGTSIFIYKLSN